MQNILHGYATVNDEYQRQRRGHKELNIDDMITQAFIFFLGDFKTSSTAMCFAHEIAANPEIQLKLQ